MVDIRSAHFSKNQSCRNVILLKDIVKDVIHTGVASRPLHQPFDVCVVKLKIKVDPSPLEVMLQVAYVEDGILKLYHEQNRRYAERVCEDEIDVSFECAEDVAYCKEGSYAHSLASYK